MVESNKSKKIYEVMYKMVKENKKSMLVKAGAIGVAGLLIGGLGGAFLFPNTVVDVKYEVNPVDAELVAENGNLQLTLEELQLYVAELEAKEPEVVTETEEVIVEVDNGNLAVVLDALYDNKGDLEFITEDLDEDEIDLIVERILFVAELKAEAEAFVLDNLAKELEYKYDWDIRDISRIRIDEITFINSESDFYRNRYLVELEVSLRYKGERIEGVVVAEQSRGKFYFDSMVRTN